MGKKSKSKSGSNNNSKSPTSLTTPRKALRCSSCGYVTFLKARYTKHVKYHSMPFIKCEFCDFKTQYTWNLDRHMKNHNNLGSMSCPLCNFSCEMKQSLTSHVQNHHNDVPEHIMALFRCGGSSSPKKSPVSNSRRQSVELDLNSNHQQVQDDEDPEERKNLFMKKFYKCRFCKFNALSELGLKRHVSQSHPSKQNLQQAKITPKNPNFIQQQMPTLFKNEKNSHGSGGSNTLKPMPCLIPIPKVNVPASSSSLEAKKIHFLSQLGLSPKYPQMNGKGNEENFQELKIVSPPLPPPQRIQKRRTSFYEKLSKKLTSYQTQNLLSQPQSLNKTYPSIKSSSSISSTSLSNSIISITSSSTRCQACRHRCKTSADLINHLKQCEEAQRFLVDEEEEDDETLLEEEEEEVEENSESFHNKLPIFVWNSEESSYNKNDNGDENSVHSGTESILQTERSLANSPRFNITTKSRKVYKCPQKDCEFWAATASRFHVHIVGHYNTKPFECSQCSYRSNWRWDITKHIKLKTMRDPSHTKAKVLLTHKSGERNYRKYDRYLVPMDVSYSADAKLPDCSTVASKRSDVELELTPSPRASPSPRSQSTNSSPVKCMPRLTKAPSSVEGCRAVGNLRELLSRGICSGGETLQPSPPNLKQVISISPISSNSNGGRTFVEHRMLAGGEIVQNMESLRREITVTEIKPGSSKSLSNQIPEEPTTWKCKKCPYTNRNKQHVIAHINLHHKPHFGESMSILSQNNLTRVEQGEQGDNLQENMDESELDLENCENFTGDSSGLILPEEIRTKPKGQGHGLGAVYKKYHCKECPYVTDSKGQFIYHKRFHMPSSPHAYNCNQCSYGVSHKHLLHQHVRVHQNSEESSDPVQMEDEDYMQLQDPLQDSYEEETKISQTHPKVLVWKGGRPYSMYRCRFCPTIFAKLADLAEHEEEHQYEESNNGAINLSMKTSWSPNFDAHEEREPNKMLSQRPQTSQGNLLYLCELCPARFLYEKELKIHHTFHEKNNEFGCKYCTYTARQEVPHLLSHMKVHSQDYQEKTEVLLSGKYKRAPKLKFDTMNKAKVGRMIPPPPPVTIIGPASATKTDWNTSSICDASIPCKRCPARFNAIASFVNHSNRHGIETKFKCKFCDFGAESQNNLILHSVLHSGSEVTIEPEMEHCPDIEIMEEEDVEVMPYLGAEIHIPTVIPQMKEESDYQFLETELSLAKAFQGNPEFKYPTYVKNGRIKSKRYKCFSCPSAFEKRDQYRVHLGLHGSNQRYKCTVCDYSVTYYANFIQHLKKHENQPNVTKEQLVAIPFSKMNKMQAPPRKDKSTARTITEDKIPPLVLTVPRTKKTQIVHLKCSKCPFTSADPTILIKHERCHENPKREKCPFCTFSSEDRNSLKNHLRVHFENDLKPWTGGVDKQNNEETSSEPDSGSDLEDADDYEAKVKKVNKKTLVDVENGIIVDN